MVPWGSLGVPGGSPDHQMLYFPSFKGGPWRAPGSPNALFSKESEGSQGSLMQTLFSSVQFSSVQLFKTSLGQAFKHLEAPWRSLEGHWRVSYPTGNRAKSNHSYRQPVCIHRFSYNLEGHTCNYKPGFSSSFIRTFIQLQIIRNSVGIQ